MKNIGTSSFSLQMTDSSQALDARVHHIILALPGCAFRPEHAAHICAIMRHLLEDPATLQAAMEAEIRSALNQKTNRSGGERSPLLQKHWSCLIFAVSKYLCLGT